MTLLLTLLMAAAVADETIPDRDFFRLYARCDPMRLAVSLSTERNRELGLTEEAIRNRVELKLRSARLYNPSGRVELHVAVAVYGHAFSVGVKFSKYVSDAFYYTTGNLAASAITWEYSALGLSDNRSYIMDTLSEAVDVFLVEYYRVNDDACATAVNGG